LSQKYPQISLVPKRLLLNDNMALAITVGKAQLLQLGISLSDVALVLSQSRKVGNWLRVATNDDELLNSIGEKQEAILKRRDLIDAIYMEKKWVQVDFVYQGQHHNNSSRLDTKEAIPGLSSFSWLMVTIIAALDVCLPSAGIRAVIRKVYTRVLGGDQELEDSLRILLTTNIESWRETGCVRRITRVITHAMKECRYKHLKESALPQLNPAETGEMEDFLVWLLEGKSCGFEALSIAVFALAVGLGKVGVKLRTEGQQVYETEPVVRYVEGSDGSNLFFNSFSARHGIGSPAQQIAYHRSDPSSMIHSMPTNRPTIISMIDLWRMGFTAGSKMRLVADQAKTPFSNDSEIYYVLENLDGEKSGFGKEIIMIAGRAFPERSESVLLAVEELAKGVKGDRLTWLHQRTELDFLKRARAPIANHADDNVRLWLQYQALVFGFYYGLLGQLVSLELVQDNAYFKGLWGLGSTTFLAMCVEFGDIVRREGQISRSHIIYMLSTMYNGRQKSFSNLSIGKGLLGIIGSTSVLARPLLRPTDVPSEISSFMLVDLPILDLAPDLDGELFASAGGGVVFDVGPASQNGLNGKVQTKNWLIHAKMGLLFGDGLPGVVMAARCDGRLVGWFNPLAADVAFLSAAYQQKLHENETEHTHDFKFTGFEVDDEDWQSGHLPRPTDDEDRKIGIVHSKGCPALRYAAAGMYMEVGDEVAIMTDDLEAAHGRVDGQGGGMIIA
jgi:hypothetical protein